MAISAYCNFRNGDSSPPLILNWALAPIVNSDTIAAQRIFFMSWLFLRAKVRNKSEFCTFLLLICVKLWNL